MREIKFRAWDGEQMVSPDYITRDGVAHWKADSIHTSSKIVIQYTGLKDKNGKEIYEGDCLDGIFGECYIGYCDKCKSFELIANDFGCLSCEGDVFWRDVVEEAQNAEVIGNIYDRPELLK